MKKQYFIIQLNWVDCVTLCGCLFAVIGIALAMKQEYAFALCFYFLAMLADAMDGMLARHFQLTRPFGRYLDGFIDAVNYLLAPAIFLYTWGFSTWYYNIIIILFIMSGIVRLAVFNEIGNVKNAEDTLAYLGMPVFWSIFILGGMYIFSLFISRTIVFPTLAILLTIFAFLMIYNDHFFKFKSWKTLFVLCSSIAVLFAGIGFGIIRVP